MRFSMHTTHIAPRAWEWSEPYRSQGGGGGAWSATVFVIFVLCPPRACLCGGGRAASSVENEKAGH